MKTIARCPRLQIFSVLALLGVSLFGLPSAHGQATMPSVPDWALPGSATHKQVPPPADFHRPTTTVNASIGIFEGQSDVGSAVVPGSAAYDAATGAYTIRSAGYNIWYTRDEFRFLWKKMSGDVSLAADATFPVVDGYGDRKVVLILRQSLDDDAKEKLFNGRDHSWMQFNRRVLEEAEDPSNPLLERVKFLAITGSNLDEYVEIRQAGLMQRIEDGYREPGYDGLRPDESLAVLTAEIHSFVDAQYRCWNEHLLPELRKQGIRLLEWKELDEEARAFAQGYFQREVDPLLTPISIDPAHPFPRVLNKALCLALLLRRKRRSSGPQVLGVVTVPRACPALSACPRPTAHTTTCCSRT
jgi:hypothetical protein